MAQRRLERRRNKRKAGKVNVAKLSLMQAIPQLTAGFTEPQHLAPLVDILERLCSEKVRLSLSVPPRHGKSETILHAAVWHLRRNPKLRILYVTHTTQFARTQGRKARKLAREAGILLSRESGRADEWETMSGGGLVCRGIDGEVTGRGFDVVIVDDPIKNRAAAHSSAKRQAVWDTFAVDIYSRAEPNASVLVVHTRWHVDDLIGRLDKDRELGFRRLNLSAIAENDNDGRAEGEALWPQRWDADTLADRRRIVGEYDWAALYQGHPRPIGGAVFGEPHWWKQLPVDGFQRGNGIDLAYTAKTHADYSVLVQGVAVPYFVTDDGATRRRIKLYVTNVVRRQCEAPQFAKLIKTPVGKDKALWYASGTEKGSAQFFRADGIPLVVLNASTDKFQRAQGTAAAWNRGDILVPDRGEHEPEWLPLFLEEVRDFTGVEDLHDDQVDALVALHDLLDKLNSGSVKPASASTIAPPRYTGFRALG